MTQLTTVKLYGDLGATFGSEFHFDVKSPIEAVRLLQANFKGFSKYLAEHSKPGYHIYVGKETVSEGQLAYPVSPKEVIKIVPVIEGSSDNQLFNVVLGAALISIAPWAGLTLGSSVAGAYGVAGVVANVGWGLVLGGIAQTLFAPPPPEAPAERPENKPSYLFNGAVNTIKQGNPVPVGYGQLRVGSQVISAGLVTKPI